MGVGAHRVLAVRVLALMHRLRVDDLDVLGQIRLPDAARIALAALQGLVLQVAVANVGGQRAGGAAGHVAHGALVAVDMADHMALEQLLGGKELEALRALKAVGCEGENTN